VEKRGHTTRSGRLNANGGFDCLGDCHIGDWSALVGGLGLWKDEVEVEMVEPVVASS